MVAHNLDIPQMTVADNQDDNNFSPFDNTSFPTSGPPMCHVISSSDTHDFLPHPTLVLTNYRTYPDVPGPPASRTSDATSLPSPGQCNAQFAHSSTRSPSTGSRDNHARVLEGENAGVGIAELACRSVEADPNVNPSAFKPLQFVALVDSKSLGNLEKLGGIEGLLHGLGTNPRRGLHIDTNCCRRLGQSWSTDLDQGINSAVTPPGVELTLVPVPASPATARSAFGVDRSASLKLSVLHEATIEDRQRILPQRPNKHLLTLVLLTLHNKVLVLLIAAVGSLALDVFLDFNSSRTEGELPVDWVEGLAIVLAIVIVVIVGSLNNWQKARHIRALNPEKQHRLVKVIRDGREQLIPISQVVVGNVVLLEPGDVIPCEGIFLSSHNVRCDESSATGESGSIKKLSYEECIALRNKRLSVTDPDGPSRVEPPGRADCFIVSGSNVLEGVGTYVVIAVGSKSLARRRDSERTPLQLKLDDLADAIAQIGCIAGGLLLVALIRYFFEPGTANLQRTSRELGTAFVNILNMAVALAVVTLPKGLPLAVTLALAFATKQMSKENLLIRALGSCETMANVSVICTDKTGILTQNMMNVVSGTVGVHAKFVRKLEENREWAGSEGRNGTSKDLVDLADLNAALPHPVKDLFNAVIAINSTAFEDVDPESGAPVLIGNRTESALLGFAKELGWPNYQDTRNSADIIQMIPFSSDRKLMGCVVRLPGGSYRLYVNGASEILARNCTRHVVLGDSAPSANEVESAPLGELEEGRISRTITSYASQALRTIALCYRDFPSWPPKGASLKDEDEIDYNDLMTGLTLISIIAIEDPLRAGAREAVANCGKAGVRVIMCTGDNALTAKLIAEQCGIYTAGGIVMEGPHFRTLSPDVKKAIIPRLQVLARSSAEDKRILVEILKDLGDVVGVTGGVTTDGTAFKTAHVGFSMGISGTEVAKEASDIILMNDNFSSIINAIMWGRCVNDSVRKFLQFLISGNVTVVVTTFVWALASSKEEPVLSAIQLLWVNLIMDIFALATDPASSVLLLDRKPDRRTDPLFTVNMMKQILGQAAYQITMILIFHFLGSQILGFHHHNDIVRTLIFNALVFAQIFNSFNCRRLDRKLNVFEGMTKNWYFMAIIVIEVAVQVLICFFGGSAFDVRRMGTREWVISLALGFVPLPLGALIRLIPNEPCERAFKKLQLLPTPELLPTTRPDAQSSSSFAMNQVGCTSAELRIHGSSFVHERHCAFPDPDSARLDSAMLLSLEASPPSNTSLSDPGLDRSGSTTTLMENGFKVHPDTSRDDPVYGLLGTTP